VERTETEEVTAPEQINPAPPTAKRLAVDFRIDNYLRDKIEYFKKVLCRLRGTDESATNEITDSVILKGVTDFGISFFDGLERETARKHGNFRRTLYHYWFTPESWKGHGLTWKDSAKRAANEFDERTLGKIAKQALTQLGRSDVFTEPEPFTPE
jgi:hypothetical protein